MRFFLIFIIRFLCDDNLLWKEKCKKAAIVIEPSTDKPKRGRAGNMPPISSPWKVISLYLMLFFLFNFTYCLLNY